jgi:peptidoglycan/xylan/chitin deacetylase (PgdA/CDA1 family)
MSLSIVMYHYVRDLARTRYPAIKGRDLAAFSGQLECIARRYTVVSAQQVVAAVKDREPLPDDAAWLTFDDGYADHFSAVFPLLSDRGWQGSFFPSADTVLHGELLDVNRIHFILAAQPDTELILTAIRRFSRSANLMAGCARSRSTGKPWPRPRASTRRKSSLSSGCCSTPCRRICATTWSRVCSSASYRPTPPDSPPSCT